MIQSSIEFIVVLCCAEHMHEFMTMFAELQQMPTFILYLHYAFTFLSHIQYSPLPAPTFFLPQFFSYFPSSSSLFATVLLGFCLSLELQSMLEQQETDGISSTIKQ
jgi:hypothetical protein